MTITLTREEAQQVLNVIEKNIVGVPRRQANDLLRTRLAQPEPEPVACAMCSGRGWYTCGASDMRLKCPECKGKKAAPPQREWQGLTDDEIIDTANNAPFETMVSAEDYIYVISRAIEVKLKEKNA